MTPISRFDRRAMLAAPVAVKASLAAAAVGRTGNPNNKALPNWKPDTPPNRETMVINTISADASMNYSPRWRSSGRGRGADLV